MRKLFIPALLILIGALIYPEIGSTRTSMEPVAEAVMQAGADFDSAEVNGFGLINDDFMEYEEMKSVAAGLADSIGSSADQYEISGEDESEYRQVILKSDGGENPFVISLQSYKLPSGNESYLIVNLYGKNKDADIDGMYQNAGDCFAKLSAKKLQITVIVTGHYDGQLAEKDMNEKMDYIMSYLNASYHKNEMYDDLFTATGYTEKISEYIKLGSEKINVDLAMRYSESDGKTYIWLGSPVITTDY